MAIKYEHADPLVRAWRTPVALVVALARERLHKEKIVNLGRLIADDALADFAKHYLSPRMRHAAVVDPDLPGRHYVRDDPAARSLSQHFKVILSDICGEALRPTYTFASQYDAMEALPIHLDHDECEYTACTLLDTRPVVTKGWEFHFTRDPRRPPEKMRQVVGDTLLFKGRELYHGRPSLPTGVRATTLLLHYCAAFNAL